MIICLFPAGAKGREHLLSALDAEGYRVRIAALPTEPLVADSELAVVELPPNHDDAAALLTLWRQALPPGHPILALGRWREPHDVHPLIEAGATDYLPYPCQTQDLAVRLLVLRGSTMQLMHNLRQRIADTQRVESFTSLAGSLAHDFNNLLAAIMGNAEVAMLDQTLSQSTRYSLEQIDRASRHAAELTRQMMTYSGRGSTGFAAVQLKDLVEDMGEILRASISRSCVAEYRFEPGMPPVLGDASQLRQVVMNLLINASEAMMPHGGVIRVAGRTAATADGRRIVLEVTDSGPGIQPELRSRIFEPFFSTKRQGRGLGLAAVRSIVQAHGGEVEIHSEPGRGSTFRLLFPAAHQDLMCPASPAEGIAASLDGAVLLVEDDAAVREAAAHLLAHAGLRVFQAPDTTTALDILRRHRPLLSAAVLDLDLPGDGSLSLLREAACSGNPLRIIVWTGLAETEVDEILNGSPVEAVLRKPCHVRQLAAEVSRVLAPRATPRARGALAGGTD